MKIKYIKVPLLAALFLPLIVHGSSGAIIENKETKPILKTADQTVNVGSSATYGGYVLDYNTSDIPLAPEGVYTFSYGVYYTGLEDLDQSIIKLNKKSSNELLVTAPYILPYNDNTYPSYGSKGLVKEFTYYDDQYWTINCWAEANYNGQILFRKGDFKVLGKKVGEKEEKAVNATFNTMHDFSVDSVQYSVVQNLAITLTDSEVKDYETLTVDLGLIRYIQKVYQQKGYGTGYTLERYIPLVQSDPLTIYPTVVTEAGGNKLANMATTDNWYEASFSSTEKRSFKNEVTALNFIKDKISAKAQEYRYSNKIYNSETYFSFPATNYEDYFGIGKAFSEVEPYDKSSFSHGSTYQICIIPEYANVSYDANLRHEISKLYAFNASDTVAISNFIDIQAQKFIKKCSVFDEVHPADAYNDSESVVFSDYDFYDSVTLKSHNANEYQYIPVNSDIPEKLTFIPDHASSLSAGNCLYSYPYIDEEGTIKSYKAVFNVWYTFIEDMTKQVKPNGDTNFVNTVNNLFSTATYSSQYINTSSATNKIQFTSNDLTFIRITKDEDESVILKAQRVYNVPDNNYATVKSFLPAEYDFSAPGKYVIDFINRYDDSPLTRTLTVFEDNNIGLEVNSANNKQLTFSINHPDESAVSSIAVYESTTKIDNVDKQFAIKEIDPLDDTALAEYKFKKLNYDNDDHAINVANSTYTFKETDSSVSNQFKKTYYIRFSLANVSKCYYINWNYVPATADTIEVSFDDWNSNVGYSTRFNINAYSSTSEEVSMESKEYTISTSTPGLIEIDADNKTIKAINSGEASITFTLKNEKDSVTKNFTITDLDEYRKEIRVNTTDFEIEKGKYEELKIDVNPSSLYSKADLTYTISDSNVARLSGGRIYALEEGIAVITISHKSNELTPVEIFVTVTPKQSESSEIPVDPESSESPSSSEEVPTSSETPSSEIPTSESSSSVTPEPAPSEDQNNGGIVAVIIILSSLVGVITFTVIFLIIRAKRTSGMKR